MSRIDDCRKDCEVPDCAYQINGDESACEKCTKPIELRGYFDIPVLARCGTYKLKPKNIEQLLPPYIILYDERGFIVKIDQKELDSANARIKELMRETDTLRQCIIDRLIETGSTEVFGNYDNYNLVALLVKEKNRRLQKLVEAATNLTDECFELESICEGDECRGNWKLFVDQYVRPIEQAMHVEKKSRAYKNDLEEGVKMALDIAGYDVDKITKHPEVISEIAELLVYPSFELASKKLMDEMLIKPSGDYFYWTVAGHCIIKIKRPRQIESEK